jgi:hypothetical protein
MDCDPPASAAVVVIATQCSCFIENKLAGFCRCWGVIFIADFYEFLEPNRHFALKMSYVLQCVYGPHRCEMRRWLLLDSIQSRRLPFPLGSSQAVLSFVRPRAHSLNQPSDS